MASQKKDRWPRRSPKGSIPQGMKWRVVPYKASARENWLRRLPLLVAQAEGRSSGRAYFLTTAMIVVLSAVFWELRLVVGTVNIALLYILPVLVSAVAWGMWPSFYSAGLSILLFDFLFVPPIFSFAVSNVQYVISFVVFLLVGTVTTALASSLRQQYQAALRRESQAQTLFRVTRQMSSHSELHSMLQELAVQIKVVLNTEATIAVMEAAPDAMTMISSSDEPSDVNQAIIRWVKTHGSGTSFGNHHTPELIYLPLKAEGDVQGVLCIGQIGRLLTLDDESIQLLQSLAELTALALFQHKAAEKARLAALSLESERLRTALLDSISHELMTPLATVTGSVTALIDETMVLSAEDEKALLSAIREGAARMRRLITNLLGMVKIESGAIRPNWQEVDVGEVIGIALHQLEDTLGSRSVEVVVPENLPLISSDPVLLEQVLVNIISNAEKYSPPTTRIIVETSFEKDTLRLSIIDFGIGMNDYDRAHAFDKFYRGPSSRHIPGTGLGLAISKNIIDILKGHIDIHPHRPEGTHISLWWDGQEVLGGRE